MFVLWGGAGYGVCDLQEQYEAEWSRLCEVRLGRAGLLQGGLGVPIAGG